MDISALCTTMHLNWQYGKPWLMSDAVLLSGHMHGSSSIAHNQKFMRRTIIDNIDDGLYKGVNFDHCLDDDDDLCDHLDVLCLEGLETWGVDLVHHNWIRWFSIDVKIHCRSCTDIRSQLSEQRQYTATCHIHTLKD